ncbi:MAG: Hsp20/alpha crystallin family protein [Chloroflexota bacterium]|nr:Hsp20/alpha crystallin family protein [Chloroflexota bacterium]
MQRSEEHLIDEIERIQRRMDRLFVEVISTGGLLSVHRPQAWHPPTDVYETNECVVVKVEIAGLRREDFSISLSGRTLTIRGVRQDTVVKQACHQLEINYGHFETEVYLPQNMAQDQIKATYEDGFLQVILPKAKIKRVSVRTGTEAK